MAIHVAIEGYDSLEQIGVGGMAAVYKARKVSIDKVVAIKVLFPYLASDPSFTDRFHREAKAAASIQHDNIVNVVDFGESDGSFYIVMEYYDGRTLEDLMKARPGVPFEVAVQILLEVAYGLEAAHALDIVHRDIKPANIIYTNQGGIKLADFGLAKKSDSVTMITQQGKVIGTPSYMSPEQAAAGPVGPSSDIFSLGVVAYELFGRRKPFEGNTYSDIIEKIQTISPPAVTEVNPLIEPEFARVVARMLAKDEGARYANAAELITDMEAAMEKCKLTRDRRRLAAYIKDPDAYDAHSNEKAITHHLSRGAYYMQKGEGHLDEALLEFRRILYLDPGNERARKNLERLRKERGDSDRTVTIDATAHAAVEGRLDPTRETTPRFRTRRASAWAYAAGAVLVAASVAATLWFGRDGGAAPFVSERGGITSAAMSEVPLLSEPMRTADSSMVTRPAPGTKQPGETSTAVDVATRDAAQKPADTASTAPAQDEREAKKPERAKPEPDASRKPADTPKVEKKAVAPVKTGVLSVYFLGGVGEVSVNGKRLTQQPPFEGLVLAAGRYRVACRMGGDETPREIVVDIVADRETVVEYEIGGTPVATFADEK